MNSSNEHVSACIATAYRDVIIVMLITIPTCKYNTVHAVFVIGYRIPE